MILYDLSKKQSLVGICVAGVQTIVSNADAGLPSIGMPEMLYFTWMGMAAKIQQRNEVVNRQCVLLQSRLSADGFQSYIMNGQGNSALYGNLQMLRQPGDIDVYLDGGFERVFEYAQSVSPTRKVDDLEMSVSFFQDTEVEFHYYPFFLRNPIKNRRLQSFFEEQKESCFANMVNMKDAGPVSVPTRTFNLVHQMVHIVHHLFTEGIGMRQLMDNYFVLKHEKNIENSVNERMVQDIVHRLGLDKFASALMWVLGYAFGMESDYMPWIPDMVNGKFLLGEIMKSGNFGIMDDKKGNLANKWTSFWYVNGKTIRFWRFDHWAWFWSPIWRMYHYTRRRLHGFV